MNSGVAPEWVAPGASGSPPSPSPSYAT
ncbi:hypothetical protein EVAR_66687_1, partial [Eumeta japonica]